MNKKVVIIVVVILLIAVIVGVVFAMSSTPASTAPASTAATKPASTTAASSTAPAATPAATPAAATPAATPAVATPAATPTAATPEVATPAPNIPYNKVQYVRIQRISPHPEGPGSNPSDPKFSIQVSEIEFFDQNGNKVPGDMIQGVNYNDGGIGFNPYTAVNTVMNDFAHTSNTPNAFLQIGFKTPINLSKIVLTSRAGFQYRMIGTEVQTFPEPGQTPYTNVAINTAKDKYTISYTPNNIPSLSSEPFSFITSLPQYLRHLQNKNFLLY